MGYKRAVSNEDEGPVEPPPPLEEREEMLVGRHTFSFAFVVSLVGFVFLFVVGTRLDLASSEARTGIVRSFGDLIIGEGGGTGDSLLYVAQVIAAILGVALTVVAIVVQLASNRYTPKILDLFVRDPVSVPTLSLFVVTVLEGMWVGHIRQEGFVPRIGIVVTFGLSTLSMLILLPYFRHIFRFLEPANVVHRIRDEIVADVRAVAAQTSERAAARAQAHVVHALDHLFDIARNAVNNNDRTLATETIFAFRDGLVRAYLLKEKLPPAWFKVHPTTAVNADFINMPESGLEQFERERNWLERKVFWQLNLVFQTAVGRMRGVCSTIALVVRELACAALEKKDQVEIRLCIRALNTLLRSGLNAQDVRTVYNLLQHYRMVGEAALAAGDKPLVREIFGHLRYYGRAGEAMGMAFVLETATHDLAALVRASIAAGASREEIDERIGIVLSLATDIEGTPLRPASRIGVRRSHAVLAVHLRSEGREMDAAPVLDELRKEPVARLAAIRDELLTAQAEFFELTERVSSFGFVPKAERPSVAPLFRSLGVPDADDVPTRRFVASPVPDRSVLLQPLPPDVAPASAPPPPAPRAAKA